MNKTKHKRNKNSKSKPKTWKHTCRVPKNSKPRIYNHHKYHFVVDAKPSLDLEKLFDKPRIQNFTYKEDCGGTWNAICDFVWKSNPFLYPQLCGAIQHDVITMLNVPELQLWNEHVELFVAWCWYVMAMFSGGSFPFEDYPMLYFLSLKHATIQKLVSLMKSCVAEDVDFKIPPNLGLVRIIGGVIADRSRGNRKRPLRWRSIKKSVITQTLQSIDTSNKMNWEYKTFISQKFKTLELWNTRSKWKSNDLALVYGILVETEGFTKPGITERPAFRGWYQHSGEIEPLNAEIIKIRFGDNETQVDLSVIDNLMNYLSASYINKQVAKKCNGRWKASINTNTGSLGQFWEGYDTNAVSHMMYKSLTCSVIRSVMLMLMAVLMSQRCFRDLSKQYWLFFLVLVNFNTNDIKRVVHANSKILYLDLVEP
ncbi:MAG: hypothetical protein ACPG2Y_00685, partial [Acholeplasmataceae bacterium]